MLPAVLPQVETLENAVSTQTTLLRESLWPTIPLQAPYQTTTQRPPSSTDMALFSEDQTIQQPEDSCHKVNILNSALDFMQNYLHHNVFIIVNDSDEQKLNDW